MRTQFAVQQDGFRELAPRSAEVNRAVRNALALKAAKEYPELKILLMTGYAESAPPMPLSRLTIAAMKDLGYGVDFSAAQSFTLSLQAQSLESIALTGVTEAVRTL